jgi:hypothetical protein
VIINHPMLFDGDAKRRRERAAAEQEVQDTLTAAEWEARQRGPDWSMAAFDKLIADLHNLSIRP